MSMTDGKGLGSTRAQAALGAADGAHEAAAFLELEKCPRCGKSSSAPSCEGKCLQCGKSARTGDYCDSCMYEEARESLPAGETLSPTYMNMPWSWW